MGTAKPLHSRVAPSCVKLASTSLSDGFTYNTLASPVRPVIVSNRYALAESAHVSGLEKTGRSHPISKPRLSKPGFMTSICYDSTFHKSQVARNSTMITRITMLHAACTTLEYHRLSLYSTCIPTISGLFAGPVWRDTPNGSSKKPWQNILSL